MTLDASLNLDELG